MSNDNEEKEFKLRTQILTTLLRVSKGKITISNEQQLLDLMELFTEWEVVRIREVREHNFARNVVYTLTKYALAWRIQDNEPVANLIKHIYARDNHFAILYWRHFEGITRIVSISNNIFEIACREDDDNFTSLKFFHGHANEGKVEFLSMRFIDFPLPLPFNVSPCILSIIQLKPQLLTLFLQYGGKLSPRNPRHDWKPSHAFKQFIFYTWIGVGRNLQEIDTLISLICLGQINRILWNVSNAFDEEELIDVLTERTIEDLIACSEILLKVIPQVIPIDLELSVTNVDLFSTVEGTYNKTIAQQTYPEWSEKAAHYLGRLHHISHTISSLKHRCRCTIRQTLYSNWKLPTGIANLPLSTELQQYINLEELNEWGLSIVPQLVDDIPS